MNTFFTSDTHFSQQRTLELSRRPFNSTDEMDEMIINNWNSLVNKDDIVHHLGDFGNYDILPKLNGNIHLLIGNYDNLSEKEYLDMGFSSVTPKHAPFIFMKHNDILLHLCHEPSKMNALGFNLYGHVHQLSMVKKIITPMGNICGLNVGTDCHFFKPVSFETVMFYHEAIMKHYDFEVFL